MLSYNELKELVPIDTNQLDQNCSRQPELFLEACKLAAEAKATSKAGKHNLEFTKATIALQYRAGTLATPGVKITETSVAALVDAHADVVKAKSKLGEADNESFLCDSLVNSFDQRRSMLNNEVTLYNSSYFQTSDIKGRNVEDQIRKVRAPNNNA